MTPPDDIVLADIEQISIHTVLADCDGGFSRTSFLSWAFQSTQSSQTVTVKEEALVMGIVFQSTQSSQTVTKRLAHPVSFKTISIHTVLADCDRI